MWSFALHAPTKTAWLFYRKAEETIYVCTRPVYGGSEAKRGKARGWSPGAHKSLVFGRGVMLVEVFNERGEAEGF